MASPDFWWNVNPPQPPKIALLNNPTSKSSPWCPIGLYRENAIAVHVIDRSAYDATSRVHAHRQRKNLSYLRNGCCIYYLRPSGAAHL